MRRRRGAASARHAAAAAARRARMAEAFWLAVRLTSTASLMTIALGSKRVFKSKSTGLDSVASSSMANWCERRSRSFPSLSDWSVVSWTFGGSGARSAERNAARAAGDVANDSTEARRRDRRAAARRRRRWRAR